MLRFLKIIEPVKCIMPLYDDYICTPEEGELYLKRRGWLNMRRSVWNINIDKSRKDSRSSITLGYIVRLRFKVILLFDIGQRTRYSIGPKVFKLSLSLSVYHGAKSAQ